MTRKGCFPYEYMSSPSKFEQTRLPPREAFYSKLNESEVDEHDYRHAEKVWEIFNVRNLKQFHDIYLTSDVTLLADVFENFRKLSMTHYHLDPLHYYTAPGLFFDACLRMTGARVEPFTDPEMLHFVEKAIRGGVATISNRYCKPNNPYVEGYDSTQPSTYLAYVDCNNLYGLSQSSPMPYGGFRFLTPREIQNFDVMTKGVEDDEGFILEVDLDYPDNLHDLHNDYPLAPEKIPVHETMLSPLQKKMKEKLGCKKQGEGTKLIPNLYPKRNYVLHYRNLQFYLTHGMRLVKIHRVLRFRQKRWLKPFVDFNTRMRRDATTEEAKAMFKLAINATFGKLLLNPRNHLDLRLTVRPETLKKWIAQPNFQQFKIINEELAMVKLSKVDIYWDKPTFAGFSILDLSKLFMYEFHYDVMLKRYGRRAKLLFTDTDSLCYDLQTDDWYDDILRDKTYYDTSDYPTDHPCYSLVNKKVLGKFKDECNGVQPLQFVGLRAKMYSFKMPGGKEKSTAKGIKRSHAKKHLLHDAYHECLVDHTQTSTSFRNITSSNHVLSTTEIHKSALNPIDDKRYLLANGMDTLAHGHYSTKESHSSLTQAT